MGVREGESADEGRAASMATSCDGFVEPLASGTFVAYSYEAAPGRRNVVGHLHLVPLGICLLLCRHVWVRSIGQDVRMRLLNMGFRCHFSSTGHQAYI